MTGDATRGGLGQVFRVREFRGIWFAEIVSIAGDQLARVALTVLVYGRTGSAAWAAITYALTFLPALLGGVLLGRLADRYPRREVMVVCDVVRAVLVALMALLALAPSTASLWALCGLLVVVVLLAPPHTSAQGALLPEVLPGPLFEAGLAVRQITLQTSMVVGFAAGGVLVAVFSPPTALAVNAASFVVSAVVLRLVVRARPAPQVEDAPHDAPRSGSGWLAEVRVGLGAVFCDPRRLTFASTIWLLGLYIVPEALAVPYAAELGAGAATAGLLMSADAVGSVVGGWLFLRYFPERLRERAIGPLALLAGLPLVLCALAPGVAATFVLWAVGGAFATACMVQAQADFVRATPDALRGRAIGVAASGMVTAQGVAALLGGLAAEAWGPRAAVVGCGAVGALIAVGITVAHLRVRTRSVSDAQAAG